MYPYEGMFHDVKTSGYGRKSNFLGKIFSHVSFFGFPLSRPWERGSEHVVYLDVRGVDREEEEKAVNKGFLIRHFNTVYVYCCPVV